MTISLISSVICIFKAWFKLSFSQNIRLLFFIILEELTGILTVINNLSSSNEKATIDAISSHMPTEPSADRLLKIISEAVSIGSIVKSSDGESFQPAHSLRPQRRPSLVHGGIVDTTKSRRCGVTENLKSPALSPTATPNPLLNGSPTTVYLNYFSTCLFCGLICYLCLFCSFLAQSS